MKKLDSKPCIVMT